MKTGSEIHEEGIKHNAIVGAIAKQMQLRKWCVEQAIASGEQASVSIVAETIYNFVIKE